METGKEKKATSPKIKQSMPKISEIALWNEEKRIDIFSINPIVSIWSEKRDSNSWPLGPEPSALPTVLFPAQIKNINQF